MKNQKKLNSSIGNGALRPKSVFKKESGPIKILSPREENKDENIIVNENNDIKINDENKDLNTLKEIH